MNNQIVELVLFRLAEGANVNAFVAAAQAIEPELAAMGGFIARELLHKEDGQWVDVVHWQTLEQAQTAAAQIMSNEKGQAFGSFIDPTSIQMMHLNQAHVNN